MSTPHEKLAQALIALKALQDNKVIAIRSSALSRVIRERLIKIGFLKEVMKGWYIPSHPGEVMGESTIWYSSFWNFCAGYCNARFGSDWCLSPEQSLLLHAGNWIVPNQLMVRSPKSRNKITNLLFATSILEVRYSMPRKADIENREGLNLYSVAAGLAACSSKFFTQYPTEARTLLSVINDPSDLLKVLLEGGHSTIAGRLAGAFRNIGKDLVADNIIGTMMAVDYDIREIDPFDDVSPVLFNTREKSPYVNRMRILWHDMRKDIIKIFPKPESIRASTKNYLKDIDKKYTLDAYHSLSIEGYKVSIELIERVHSGKWGPETDEEDIGHKNALAARGYWQAFQSVRKSIEKVLLGENPGKVASDDHRDWYMELFQPSVAAGILTVADLTGYRNSQVYIRNSKHVPPNRDAIRDLMPAFFELLENEPEASVRIVLGHFFYVYIHPYMDGNGRTGRFLMNVMFASGGYPWLIVPVEQRERYMHALEAASVAQNIIPFCEFIGSLLVNDNFGVEHKS